MTLIILSVFLFPYVLWLFYLAGINLVQNKDKISDFTHVIGLPLVIIGGLMDVVFNITYGSLLFLDIPREWPFTERLERHLGKDTWRGKIARWFCYHLLDPFDESQHCDEECE